MIPDQDYYVDKDGKLTDDPEKYARQIAVKGYLLDERVARRYGIVDTLVSVDEPNRPVKVRGGASVHIQTADEEPEPEKESDKKAEKEVKPAEAADAASQETEATQPAKKGAKKKK